MSIVAHYNGYTAAAEEISYSRDVRPILSSKCFKCHGPDDTNRQSGLRLDVQSAAVGAAESGLHAIIPGRPEDSELTRRIQSTDDAVRMPPPESNLKVTSAQMEVLKQWIAQSAKYEPHWAFVPPKQVTPPGAVKDATWPRNAIDHFVLARLERTDLQPSPEADRATLIRRVSLDLIGLPPTLDEVDAFVNDTSPDAYERVVDRLLASPNYGERWARRWLDLARYADTNGYEKDRPRSIWPYRDWVINALNADMPFDQFTIEQIAGDMLPGATPQQRIATGFHRNTMLNEEGGIDPQEFRFYSLVDRVNTTATVWLGLTMGCAQCHTHKFDPLTHRDYYQMLALFNNADEPEFQVPDPVIAARRQELETKIAELKASLSDKFPLPSDSTDDGRPEVERRRAAADVAFSKWLQAQHEQAVAWKVLEPRELKANLARLTVLDDGSVLASGDQTKRDVYELELPAAEFDRITAVRLEVLPHPSLPNGGPGRVYYEGSSGDFFLSEFQLAVGDRAMPLGEVSESYCRGTSDGAKFSAAMAVDGQPHTGWSIDGGQGRAHQAVFRLAQPLEQTDSIRITMIFERYHAVAIGRFRIWATDDARAVKAQPMPTDLQQLCLTPPGQLGDEDHGALRKHFFVTTPELAEARKEMDNLRGQLPNYNTTLTMQERAADFPRATHRHHRGEYLRPKEAVQPGVPAVLQAAENAPPVPRNRLELARWFVDPRNPLVGRVTMNRHWAALFGRGLVRTSEDFGYQGELPTHPELLDWLAFELPRRNWSIKAMHRLIVTSATYRQSARVTERHLRVDPENKLLSRGPRVRLEAEQIRDQPLAASGLLSRKIGGPSVFPPQPATITSEGAYGPLAWNVSTGEDRYRRGLYTFSKRTAPFAMFNTFDAPSGEVCIGRREMSNTPLQALTLLNDEVFVEAAQALGRMMADQPGTNEERMKLLFRRCLVRLPTEDELAKLLRFFETQRQRFSSGKAEPTAVASAGDGDASERAAWTVTARSLLNLDEMVTKE